MWVCREDDDDYVWRNGKQRNLLCLAIIMIIMTVVVAVVR